MSATGLVHATTQAGSFQVELPRSSIQLLDLPAEVRLKIFEYLFARALLLTPKTTSPHNGRKPNLKNGNSAILQTSKKLRAEGMSILYSSVTFRLQSAMFKSKSAQLYLETHISENIRARLRYLEIGSLCPLPNWATDPFNPAAAAAARLDQLHHSEVVSIVQNYSGWIDFSVLPSLQEVTMKVYKQFRWSEDPNEWNKYDLILEDAILRVITEILCGVSQGPDAPATDLILGIPEGVRFLVRFEFFGGGEWIGLADVKAGKVLYYEYS